MRIQPQQEKMATPSTTPFPVTGDPAVDTATHGYYWQAGSPRTIRWAVAGGLDGEYWNNPTYVANQINPVFATISYYTNVTFTYAGAYANPVAASPYSDITISLSASTAMFPSSSMWARAFFPNAAYDAVYAGAPGDVFLNVRSQANSLSSYAPGSAGYFVFLHEIGHALGLKHPHDDGGTGHPTLSQIGIPSFDKDWFSIMSYRDDYNYNLSSWDPATPMPLDVLALQYLYGKNMATNATDSTYTLPINNVYSTVWDAGGSDGIDLRTSTQGWIVNLPDVQLSSLVDTKVGFAMLGNDINKPSPTTFYWLMGDIEDIAGSAYVDALSGSSKNNGFMGGGSNDYIDGLDGTDTAYYGAGKSNYTVTRSNASTTVTAHSGTDGSDTLVNIERIRFTDSMLAFDGTGQSGYRLYQAAFARKPDAVGLGYWISQLDKGLTLQDAAWNFIASVEFQIKYGGNLDTAGFVTALYANVLQRAPDTGGFQYWTDLLDRGVISRHSMLAEFSESPENVDLVQKLGSINNGVEYIFYS